MSKISVFQDNSGNAKIKRDKLETFLKEVKSDLAMEHISGNESASVQKTMTLAIACQKLFNELEELKSKPKRNCDVGNDWLKDFYCHFKPPKGMREMPPEWVDAITEFCKWLVSPANTKMKD